MAQYHNIEETKRIGENIRSLRKNAGQSINDIAYRTGFSQSLLSLVENGGETNTSHLIEIAKAIGIHPKQIFDIPFDIKPRYPQSPHRKDRNLLTFRINSLYEGGQFFKEPKLVEEIINSLTEQYNIHPNSSAVSQVLKRLVENGKLTYTKVGRQNQYSIK